jgi:CDP-diacylglycerol---glycerol-3-phosphate 3-phosphatidyltransferase
MLNVPNLVTISRIILIPLLIGIFYAPISEHAQNLTATGVFIFAGITDWLDGYLARRRRQITWFGQVMDPIADKLLTSAAFVSLVQLDLAPAWMVTVIIGREIAITGLRSVAHARGVTIVASPLGKGKMASQVTAILLLLVGAGPMPWVAPAGRVALWVVMAMALVSAADYYRRFQTLANARVTDVTIARARSGRRAS